MSAKPFEIYWDKYRIAISCISLALYIIILFTPYFNGRNPSTFSLIIKWFVLLYCFMALIPLLFHAFSIKYPPLSFNEEGITSRTSAYKKIFIPWRDVQDIEWSDRYTSFLSKGSLSLILNAPHEFNEKQSGVIGFFRRLFKSRRVSIRLDFLLCDYDDLKTLLQVKLDQHKNKV